MKNMEGPRPGPGVVQVDANASSIVVSASNAQWPIADTSIGGLGQIGDIQDISVFSAGDTIQIANQDGTTLVSTVLQILPPSSLIVSNPTQTTFNVKNGASITKLLLMTFIPGSTGGMLPVASPQLNPIPNNGFSFPTGLSTKNTSQPPSGVNCILIGILAGDRLNGFIVKGANTQVQFYPPDPLSNPDLIGPRFLCIPVDVETFGNPNPVAISGTNPNVPAVILTVHFATLPLGVQVRNDSLSPLFVQNIGAASSVDVTDRVGRLLGVVSGTIDVTDRIARLLGIVSDQQGSTLHQTGTGAVNTGVTVTLPAVAAQFHYITAIEVVKLYSVVGVANGAGVIITSTNLPGNPAWTTEQLASVAGTAVKVVDYRPVKPLKSSVVNTATTIVCPLQLQTIWRVNVSYFTAA